ncbi:MAG: HEAT repeat domain-containing protein [Deltaproteobacteria bacterium]|nr:HEAT repeat domain-containing protein [Deltaproteobacteria bacterium]
MESLESRGTIVIGGDPSQRPLTAQEEQKVMDILNATMAALGKVQQYPTLNEIVFEAIDEAGRQILTWLRTHKTLTFEAFHGNLQVNKSVLSMASTKKDFAQAFLFYLTERNVRTLDLRVGADKDEIQRFFEYFGKPAKEIVAKKNLPRSLKRMGIKHINISSELVLDNVIIKTKISDELSRQLAKLNVEELLEKANILSQIDVNTLSKVGEIASVVTNLSYAKQDAASQRIIDRLADSLTSHDRNSRLQSAKAFSQIAEKAVDYTLYGLHNSVGSVMSKGIAREDDPEVYSALATGLEKAAEVHIAKGDYEAAMKIIAGFDATAESAAASAPVKKRAEFALTKIASPQSVAKLIQNLEEAPRGAEGAPITALSGMGDKSVPALVDFIYTTDSPVALERAVATLKGIGAAALPELYAELGENMDDRYRVAFIDVIGEVGNVKSVVKLAPMASHYNPDVRAAAFRALSRIGGPAAENKMLEEIGKGSADAKFVEARIKDFGTFRNKGLAPVLIELLAGKGVLAKYATPEVEAAAATALGGIGGPEALAALSQLLSGKSGLFGIFGGSKSKDPVQVAACAALGKMGDPAAKDVLEKAVKSKSPAVQGAAKLGLQALAKSVRPAEGATPSTAPTRVTPVPRDETVAESTRSEFIPHPAEESVPAVPSSITVDMTGSVEPPAPTTEYTFESVDEADAGFPDFDAEAPPPAEAPSDFASSLGVSASRIKLIVTVGPHVVPNIRVRVPFAALESRTDPRGVAEFELAPGRYEILLDDQAFSVKKNIVVESGDTEIPIDLQDIFNF